MTRPWIRTCSGVEFALDRIDPEAVRITDIAHHLALINRWTGATLVPYSVARHSVFVSHLCRPEDALAGLLHDAAEGYINDVARPVKRLMPRYRSLEHRLATVIARKFGAAYPWPDSVLRADEIALATEARDLMHTSAKRLGIGARPAKGRLQPTHWLTDELEFLDRFKELTGGGK